MTKFDELDRYLAMEFSIDYWSDEAVLYARYLIEQLTPADWRAVASVWRNRSSEWKYRCADVLSRGAADFAVPILLKMIETLDDELTTIAADSLNSLIIKAMALPRLEDIAVAHLRAVAQRGSNVDKLIINQLFRNLNLEPVI